MSSLLTNASAMTALQTLSAINKNLSTTQARISTGQKVATAADNAAYWSIATTMRSDNGALGAVQEALGLGAAKVDTAYAGMEQAIEYVKEIKNKLVTAQEPSADKEKIQGEIKQLKDQLEGIAKSASFSGENWLQSDLSVSTTKTVVASFVRDDKNHVSVEKLDYTLTGKNVLFDTSGGNLGILDKTYNVSQKSVTVSVNTDGVSSEHTVAAYSVDDLIALDATFTTNTVGGKTTQLADVGGAYYVKINDSNWVAAIDVTGTGQEAVHDEGGTYYGIDTGAAPATNVSAGSSIKDLTVIGKTGAQLDALISGVDAALTDMTSAAASLGSISSRITMQNEFVSKLMDSLDRGIGRLVDADMEKESARLSALQVQQQLGIQALSMANSNSQSILSLFR